VEIFELWPAALFVVCGLVGLCVGSFLNVVAYRLPIMMDIAWRRDLESHSGESVAPPVARGARFDLIWPRSACPSCSAPIAAWHNIPVLSYLWLRGRCAACRAPVSKRYPIVEGLAAALGLVVAFEFGPLLDARDVWLTVAALGFTWTLLALALIDFDTQLLPDSITLPLLWAGLLLALVEVDGAPLFTDLRSSVLGAAAGYLSLWTVYQLFKLATGKEGMGYGDFKLLAVVGAWLGWQLLPVVILVSAAVGSIVGISLIVFGGRSRHTAIPFGPYLAAAAWIALLWGRDLMAWYAQFLR
jgi:leader peptidase (prepilin peptidase)/N-methyltransferase